MDTLSVKLVESGPFYSDLNFYSLIIASLSFIVAFFAIYLQFKSGEIEVPEIKSFGLCNLLKQNEPSGFYCVLPILFYNNGNTVLSVNDVRLKISNNNKSSYLNFSHFCENLGLGKNGSHHNPKIVDWAHQFIVPPKGSTFYVLDFITDSKNNDYFDLELGVLVLELQIKRGGKRDFETYQSFKITLTEEKITNFKNNYIVYSV